MPHPIAEFLTTMGVEVDEEAVEHYGVKGMQWGKKLTPEELKELARQDAELESRMANADPNWGKMTRSEQRAKMELYKKATKQAQDKRVASANSRPLLDTTRTVRETNTMSGPGGVRVQTKKEYSSTRQGAINKFIEDNFVDKKVSRQTGEKGNSREVVTRQGKVNKFIEDMVNKVKGK